MFFRITTALASVLLILCSAPVADPVNSESHDTATTVTVASSYIADAVGVVEVPADADISFNLIDLPPSVRTVKPPVEVMPEEVAPVPVVPAPPVQITPPAVQAPPVAPPPAPPAPAGPEVRYINVALAGGQDVIDWQAGPVLFPLAGFPPYVAEHDYAGGWARFGTLSAGMQVNMSGLVTGTYTVGQIINVPKGGNTDEFSAFATMPKVLLQTCVPGTSRMIVVGLY